METSKKITKNKIPKRTKNQNAALHLYFTHIAEALNNEGFDVRVVLQVISEKGIDMMWSPTLVKELLWRRIQKKYLDKQSTTELDSLGDITQIYDIMNKFLAENFYISEEFPSLESLENEHTSHQIRPHPI